MRSTLAFTGTLAFFFFWTNCLPAQGYRWDNAFWQGLSFSQKISGDWSASVGSEFRMENNLSALDQWNLEGGVRYTPFSWLRLGAGYRMAVLRQFNEHRFDFSVAYKQGLGKTPFDLTAGLKLQKSYAPIPDDESTPLRPFLRVAYDKKGSDWRPSAGGELFADPWGGAQSGLQRYRLMAAVTYDLNKRNSIALQYIYQQDVNQPRPDKINIFNLSLNVELDFIKKKGKPEEDDKPEAPDIDD